jgi:hypothetical protein
MSVTTGSHWNPFRRHALGTVVEKSTTPARTPPASKSKTWETTVDRVPSWPEEARRLKNHTWLSYLYVIGDFILVLLPLFFIRESNGRIARRSWSSLKIVLGVAVVTLNGKPTKDSDFGKKVEFVMDLVSRISVLDRALGLMRRRAQPYFRSCSPLSRDEA